MQRVEWSREFEIGIKVIDTQHKRIVEYINTLAEFKGHASHDELAELIDALSITLTLISHLRKP